MLSWNRAQGGCAQGWGGGGGGGGGGGEAGRETEPGDELPGKDRSMPHAATGRHCGLSFAAEHAPSGNWGSGPSAWRGRATATPDGVVGYAAERAPLLRPNERGKHCSSSVSQREYTGARAPSLATSEGNVAAAAFPESIRPGTVCCAYRWRANHLQSPR